MAKKPDMYAMLKAKTADHKDLAAVVKQTVDDVKWQAAAPTSDTPQRETATSQDLAAVTKQTVATFARASENTRPRENVIASAIDRPKGFNVRPPRIEKPHQSVYAHPKVFAALRQIAANEEIKPQDLYREGLRHVLAQRGYDFDKLDAGEA